MIARACLVAALSALAACSGASGRGGGDLGSTPSLPMCPSYPHGVVSLFETASSTSMLSLFQKAGNRTCMTATADACSALIYAPLAADAGLPPVTDAGVISVAGGAMPIIQSPNGSGYTTLHATSSAWSGGESITVSAAGGEVPAFATTLVAPAGATLTMPAARPMTIARASDLALSWSGSGFGVVEVLLNVAVTGMPDVEIHCRYPLAPGQGVVPASILANLPAGSTGTMVMMTTTPQTVQAGDWAVDVALETAAVDQAGAAVVNQITID